MHDIEDSLMNGTTEYTSPTTGRQLNRRRLIQLSGGIAVVAAVAGSTYSATNGSASTSGSGHLHPARQSTPTSAGTPQLGEQADGTRTWRVRVGGMDMENLIDIHAFLPGEITINAGDSVWFEFNAEMPGAHTVTFTSGAEAPAFEIPDPDAATPTAGPPVVIANPEVLFPVGESVYGGTGYVNSGVDFMRTPDMPPFVLTFTEPGTYEYVCVVHKLVMRASVIVQETGADVPMDQAAYDALAEEQFAALVSEGRAAIEEYAEAVPTERADGTTLWEMSAGVGGESQARVMRFLPDNLEISVGDTVRWVNRSVGEPHTVTFLGGEEAPELLLVEPQPAGPPKFVFNDVVILPQGDSEYDGTGYTNSGFLATPLTNTDSYELTFTAAGEFEYVCVLHPGMEGTITVR